MAFHVFIILKLAYVLKMNETAWQLMDADCPKLGWLALIGGDFVQHWTAVEDMYLVKTNFI